MECSRIRAILLENAGDDLPAEIRESVERHLAVCPACARQAQLLQAQARALGSLPRLHAPADFLSQVNSRLDSPPFWKRLLQKPFDAIRPRYALHLAGTAAAAILVLVTVRIGFHDSDVRKANLLPSPPVAEAPAPMPAAGPEPAQPRPETATRQEIPAIRHAPGDALKQLDEGASKAGIAKSRPLEPRSSPAASARKPAATGQVSAADPIEITLRLTVAAPAESIANSSAFEVEPPRAAASAPAAARPGVSEKRAARSAMIAPERAARPSPPEFTSTRAEIARIITRANGRVLSPPSPSAESAPEWVLAEIPAGSLAAVRKELSILGKIAPSEAEHVDYAPDAKLRLKIRLDPSGPP